jgi:hypothetical protein
MGEQRSLGDVIEGFIRHELAHVHTSLPAKVTSYDPTTNTVDVEFVTKPDFHDPDTRKRVFEERPSLGNVPVIWPRGGGYVVTVPLAAGDFVWLMFSEQGLAEWRASGQVSEPVDARRHSIGWPYAMPGAFPDSSPLASSDVATRTSKMILGEDGGPCQIVFDKASLPDPTIRIGRDATVYVALSTLVQTALDAIKTAYDAHVHPVPALGTSGVPATPLGTLGPVAAVVTKAK